MIRKSFILFLLFVSLISCVAKQTQTEIHKLVEIRVEDVKGFDRNVIISFTEEIENSLTAKLMHMGIREKVYVRIPYIDFESEKKRIKVCFDINGKRFALISFFREGYIFEKTLRYSLEKIIGDAIEISLSDNTLFFRMYAHNC